MRIANTPPSPVDYTRNPATYRMSLWLAPLVLALAYFATLEGIAWLTAFNLLIAALLLTNYIVLRATSVLRIDADSLRFHRRLWERHHRPLEGLETVEEDVRRFTLRWQDGTTLDISKQHFLETDLPDVTARLGVAARRETPGP